ncbi:hypothetical protein M413DRAFT_70691 [Hebeloma cylindrosporum]|uniref:Uncharacterized protein n=1 Tax=Hebeloma cylindrosporum TaxID=76867 RepID=A0A0C3CFU3_HEBCY|nr:hypothetical protein M413DRAFT_70691 [Hebeloma cylindrosporum h7]
MTAIMPYHPSASVIDFAPFTAFSDVTHNVSPLFYKLKSDDFHTYAMDNGETYHCLDQGTGIALWWTLKRLYREIIRAATAQIPRSADLPLTVPAHYHIPDYLFQEIDLAPPTILNVGYIDCINALYMYAPKQVIQAFWLDFQDVGRQAVRWIETARYRSDLLGDESSWDWNTAMRSQLDFPTRRLLTNSPIEEGQNSYPSVLITYPDPCRTDFSDASEEGSDMADDTHHFNSCTDLVLHPTLSNFAQTNPDFDVFAGQLTINTSEDPIIVEDLPALTSTTLSSFIYNIYNGRSSDY